MATEIVSVEDFQKKSLWDELSFDKKTVTIIETDTGETAVGHGRDTQDATDAAVRKLESS